MDKKLRIITHSGTFHADELLAVAALELYLKGTPYEIIRTRDMDVIATGDFVVDVGMVYNPEMNRFDHHQEGGAGERENGIPYSSFGLVWKKYGEEICGSRAVALAIDKSIGHPVDMGDNGRDYYTTLRPDTEPLILNYIVAMFRPTWKGEASFDDRFFEILPILRRLLELAIVTERERIQSGELVEAAYQSATDKRIIVLDGAFPWQDALAHHPEPLFVVKPKNQNTWWEVECVRDNPYGFTNRKSLPPAWGGKRDGELAEITGVPDVVFCHNQRYIVVAETKEGALRLAQLALDAP